MIPLGILSQGPSQFIMALAAGQNTSLNKVIRSEDGATWTDSPTSFAVNDGIATSTFGNDEFILTVVGVSGVNRLGRSSDGVTWSYSTTPAQIVFSASMSFGNGLFVLSPGTTLNVFTSPDGVTWTARASGLGASASPYGVTYGAGYWVVCGLFGRISSSTDGVTWTLRLNTSGNRFNRVAYKSNVWVVGGFDGIWRSTNGTSFSQTSSFSCNDIAAGSGLFIAGQNGGGLQTSPDGNTWTTRTSGFGSTNIRACSFSNGLYLIGGGGSFSGGGKLATSPDGITWTLRTTGFGGGGNDVIETITSTTWAQP